MRSCHRLTPLIFLLATAGCSIAHTPIGELAEMDLMIGPYGSYAGDIVLLAKAGLERPIENRFYFGDPETSEHGSACAQDSRVPLLLAHPLHTGEELRRMVREALGAEASQLDFVPLVRDLVAEPVVKR